MTPAQKITYDLVIQHGSIRAASRAANEAFSSTHRKYTVAKKYIEADQAIQGAMIRRKLPHHMLHSLPYQSSYRHALDYPKPARF